MNRSTLYSAWHKVLESIAYSYVNVWQGRGKESVDFDVAWGYFKMKINELQTNFLWLPKGIFFSHGA